MIFTEKEPRGLVSYCPLFFFLLDERLPQKHWFFNLHGLSQSFSITDAWSQLKLLKQLPNLIPKVTYLSNKKKMHKCIILIVGISNRAGINMKNSPAGTSSTARSSFSLGDRKGKESHPVIMDKTTTLVQLAYNHLLLTKGSNHKRPLWVKFHNIPVSLWSAY